MKTKGIILAAGKGTRLYPMTKPVCKPLLPVYDKPLIYYSLSIMLKAKIDEVFIIVPTDCTSQFEALFGNGIQLGIKISYLEQKIQRGIADAFIIGTDFIGNDNVCLTIGDNIFYCKDLQSILLQVKEQEKGAHVFGYYVDNPRPFGVVEFDNNGNAISIEEKPKHPKSNYIIPGLYFYDSSVVEIAQNLKPSDRSELEITDVNLAYLQKGELKVTSLDKNFVWLDAGTAVSLYEASGIVKKIQDETGRYIGCIEEDALKSGLISTEQVHETGKSLSMTLYGQYLLCM